MDEGNIKKTESLSRKDEITNITALIAHNQDNSSTLRPVGTSTDHSPHSLESSWRSNSSFTNQSGGSPMAFKATATPLHVIDAPPLADSASTPETTSKVANSSVEHLSYHIDSSSNRTPASNIKEGIGNDNHPPTDYLSEGFRLKFNRSMFPLPDWLDSFLDSQPIETHNNSLADPNQKFIVMTCHKFANTKEEDCGGFSDRMKLLPYMLWVAKTSQRMLLIRYSKPYPLEEFLVPPPDGFDWRLPDGYFENEFEAYANRTKDQYMEMRRYVWHNKIKESKWKESRVVFVNCNLAIPAVVDKLKEWIGFTNNEVMAGVFRRLFQPTPPVAKIIESIAEENGLIAGQYAGAHTRLKFPFKNVRYIWLGSRSDKDPNGLVMSNNMTRNNVQVISHNALNCAMKIMPETKLIYFASDATEAVAYLMRESPWAKPKFTITSNSTLLDIPKVIARPDFDRPSAHFDKSGTKPSPDGLYNVFVDLWILSHARCISHGVGGYPRFAAQLTGNYDICRTKHRLNNSTIVYCPEFLHKLGVDFESRLVIPEW